MVGGRGLRRSRKSTGVLLAKQNSGFRGPETLPAMFRIWDGRITHMTVGTVVKISGGWEGERVILVTLCALIRAVAMR